MTVGLSDIARVQENFVLLVSHFQASIWALNRRRGNVHKPDRKTGLTFNTSQQYLRILLMCFRARRSEQKWLLSIYETAYNPWSLQFCYSALYPHWYLVKWFAPFLPSCSSLATLVLSNLQVMRCPPTMLESLIIWRQNDSFSLKHWTCQQYILGTLPTSWQYIKLSQAGYNFKSLVSLKIIVPLLTSASTKV